MKHLSKNSKLIFLIGIIWFVLILAVQLYYIPTFQEITGQTLLDLGNFDESNINSIVASYGTDGIDFYRKIQIVDFFVPVLFGTLLTMLCLRFLFMIKGKYYILGYLPLFLTFFDLIENTIIFKILNSFPEPITANLSRLLINITTIKNSFYGLSFLLTIGLVIFWLIKKFRTKSNG